MAEVICHFNYLAKTCLGKKKVFNLLVEGIVFSPITGAPSHAQLPLVYHMNSLPCPAPLGLMLLVEI